MACSTFQEQMQVRLFGRPGDPVDDGELAEHVEACAECRAEWQRLQTLADAVCEWKANVPDIDVTDRVISAWRQHAERSKSNPAATWLRNQHASDAHTAMARPRICGSRQPLAASLAALAALVAFVALFDRPVTTSRPAGSDLIAVRDRHTMGSQVGMPSSPDVRTVVSDVGAAYLALVQDTAGVVNSATAMAVPDGFWSPPGTAESVPGMPWLEGVGRGWEPIQKTVGTMIDIFFRPPSADDPSQT
jgi:hypothetical protein